MLREYEDFYNRYRPHRTLDQAAPLRPLPDGVTDLDQFRIRGATVPEALFMSIAWWHSFPAPAGQLGRSLRGPCVLQRPDHSLPAAARTGCSANAVGDGSGASELAAVHDQVLVA